MRSYIVRVYSRPGGDAFSGTVEAVDARAAAPVPPQPFASTAELLQLVRARPRAVPAAPALKRTRTARTR